jgi:hypothetical protein
MSAQITTDELHKVLANLGKLRLFFASRARWSTSADGNVALLSIRAHLDGLDAALTRLMENNGIQQPAEPDGEAEALPDGELNTYRMTRFQAYLEQLETWFLARTESILTEDLTPIAAEVWGTLRATAAATSRIANHNHLDSAPPPRKAAAAQPAARSASTPAPAPPDDRPRGPTPKLELDPQGDPPLLDQRNDTYELSAAARELLDGFLEQAEVQMSSRDRHQLERKVERWLLTTPDGQLLVLKITDMHGVAAPYPTYRLRPSDDKQGDW